MQNHRYRRILSPVVSLAFVLLATGIGSCFRAWSIPETNIVIVYILSAILAARFTCSYVWALITTVLATCMFNYFFTEPYRTLKVNDASYWITFLVMSVTAYIVAALTARLHRTAQEAAKREREARALYHLTDAMTDAREDMEIAETAVNAVSDFMNCQTAFLCMDASGHPHTGFLQRRADGSLVRRTLDGGDILMAAMKDLRTDCLQGEEFWDWPVQSTGKLLGVLRIPSESARQFNTQTLQFLHSMIETIALALYRLRSTLEEAKFHEEIVQERYRSNLLRAISHDLRTPLMGIMGTSEMILAKTKPEDTIHQLGDGIYRDAARLHSLVNNILNLTRLQDGKIILHKQPEAVEEVVGSAIALIEKRETGRTIEADIPEELLLIPMDARLIDQVLVNLFDNAIKHTPESEEIKIVVQKHEDEQLASFHVIDGGTGIPASDLPHIFQQFYTTDNDSSAAHRGIGLGLAICESIVTAHGGTLTARNRRDRSGAEFIFTLPLRDCSDTAPAPDGGLS